MTAVLLLALLAPSVAAAGDAPWPRFRGPNGSGVAAASGLPTEFGPARATAWSVEVPFGSSSPVVTADSVYLTGADAEHLSVLRIDRASGALEWARHLERRPGPEVYPANDPASPSPATDGENVYAFFPERGLVSYDRAGALRWERALGPFECFYGLAASPVLAGDTLLLLCDQQRGSYLLAVDAATGAERWRTERAGLIDGWATPLVYPADAPRQVIAFGSFFVCGYDLEGGAELWRMPRFGYAPVCSPVLDGDRLYVSVPYHAEEPLPGFEVILGSDADGDGRLARAELTGGLADHFGWADADKDGFIVAAEWQFCVDSMSTREFGLVAIDLAPLARGAAPRELWRHKKGLPSIGSPLVFDGLVYLVRDGGVLTALDAETGAVRARERLEGLDGELYPSPVAADGRLYVAGNAGGVVVREAGAEGATLAANDLGDEITATPAMAGDALFVRTRGSLRCFREPAD